MKTMLSLKSHRDSAGPRVSPNRVMFIFCVCVFEVLYLSALSGPSFFASLMVFSVSGDPCLLIFYHVLPLETNA